MTRTRSHTASVEIDASPDQVFRALVTPSAIRVWWSAARVIVNPKKGGMWAAVWGGAEDEPDFVTTARFAVFSPGKRIVLTDYDYLSKDGPLPFKAAFATSFTLKKVAGGTRLVVKQDGFPSARKADAFYEACEIGWRRTLASLQEFLEASKAKRLR